MDPLYQPKNFAEGYSASVTSTNPYAFGTITIRNTVFPGVDFFIQQHE